MIVVRLVGAVVLALTLGAPAPVAEDALPSPLVEALAFVPDEASPASVSFVDWAQLKELHGGAGITSAGPLADRQRLLLEITRTEAAPMALGLDRLATWADAWGWDATDLDWEIRAFGSYVVMRAGEQWDAQPFRDALEDAGYEARGFDGGMTYQPGSGAEVASKLRLAHINGLGSVGGETSTPTVRVAISDDGRSVGLCRQCEAGELLRVGLGTDPAAVAESTAGRAAHVLGRPLAAEVFIAPATCSQDPDGYFMGQARAIAASVAPLQRYEALAAGYTRADASSPAEGRIVLAYARAQQARDDLPMRHALLVDGYPLREGVVPNEEVAFDLVEARADGSELILEVAPVSDVPAHLFHHTRDLAMLYAICEAASTGSS